MFRACEGLTPGGLVVRNEPGRFNRWLRNKVVKWLDLDTRGVLSYYELHELIEQGVIDAHPKQIKGSSIDVTLDDVILLEDQPKFNAVVDLARGEKVETYEKRIAIDFGYQQTPGEFLLGSTREKFNMPLNLSAEYKLKSTQGRNGNEHLAAGWIDPGFKGNLTLEMVNCTRWHRHTLRPGMPIGQIVFFKHAPVPERASYARNGQYHGQIGVTAPGRLR
jgi:dCTP deaminase